MGNANDHVACEDSDDFPRVSNCANLSSSMMPRCGCVRATDVLDARLALARNYTTRLRYGTVSSLARNGARVSRVDHLEHRRRTGDGRGAAGVLEARFFGRSGQEIPERMWIEDEGIIRIFPPSGRHKGAHYTPVYLWRILAGVHLAGARGDSSIDDDVFGRDTQPSTVETVSYAMRVN